MTSCDSAELCGNSRGMTRGSLSWYCLTKRLFPQTSMNQQCWKTYLKLWVCSQLPLHFCRMSGEPGHSLIKAIAAIEAQSLSRLRNMAECPFMFFASLLNLTIRLEFQCVSKWSPRFCRNWCFQPCLAFILEVSASLRCLKRYSYGFQF